VPLLQIATYYHYYHTRHYLPGQLGDVHSLVCVSVLEGVNPTVIWPSELQDEEALFIPTLPSECCVSVDCFTLTSSMHVFHLIPDPLPFAHLIRGRPTRPATVCSVTMVHLEISFMLCNVMVGPDPGLFESRAEILDVTLRLCMMSAENAGSRRRLAPFVKHSIALKLSGDRLHHPFLGCG
jgi:hypothetical protein